MTDKKLLTNHTDSDTRSHTSITFRVCISAQRMAILGDDAGGLIVSPRKSNNNICTSNYATTTASFSSNPSYYSLSRLLKTKPKYIYNISKTCMEWRGRSKASRNFKQMSRHLLILQRWRSIDGTIIGVVIIRVPRHLDRNVTTVPEPKSIVNGTHTKNKAVALEPLWNARSLNEGIMHFALNLAHIMKPLHSDLSLLYSVPTGSGAQPASNSERVECSFSSGKVGWSEKPTSHLHLVPRWRMSAAMPPLPFITSWRAKWLLLLTLCSTPNQRATCCSRRHLKSGSLLTLSLQKSR